MRKNSKTEWMEKLAELMKYGLAGGICTIVNLVLFALLEKTGMHYIAANVFSYVAAVLLNFFLSTRFVFRKKMQYQGKEKNGLMRFLLIRGGNLLADNGLFYFCVSMAGMSVYFSRLGLTFLETVITYGLVKTMVFQEKENECV